MLSVPYTVATIIIVVVVVVYNDDHYHPEISSGSTH